MGSAVRLLERSGPGVLHNDLSACNDYHTGPEAGAKVQCPTLMLLGELDMMSPPKRAQELARAIASVTVAEIEGCGHMLMGERPEQVLDSLIEHVM